MDTFYPLDEFRLLTASPSFCDLTHYSEVRLFPTSLFYNKELTQSKKGWTPWRQLFKTASLLREQDRPILPYLYPQATMRFSPIFRIQPFWYLKKEFIIHAEITMQLFYGSDGTISFVIIGVEKFAILEGCSDRLCTLLPSFFLDIQSERE